MTSTATHALRDKWFVSFLPLLTADTVNTEFKGDWKVAAQKKMQRLDWVTTVEEVWSTMNSLPKIQHLGVGTTFIFSREDKEPSFETFPSGSRLVVKLFKPPVTEKGLETIVAAVLGEIVTEEVTDGVPVCDVIRIAARPSREHSDLVRVEVWLSEASYSAKVTEFLKNTFRDRGISSHLFAIEENPFEAAGVGSVASTKPVRTPLGASSPLVPADKESSLKEDSPDGKPSQPQAPPLADEGDAGRKTRDARPTAAGPASVQGGAGVTEKEGGPSVKAAEASGE